MFNSIIKLVLKCGIIMSILLTTVDIIEVNATEESVDSETKTTETLENISEEDIDTIDKTAVSPKNDETISSFEPTNSTEIFEKSNEINSLSIANISMQNSQDSIDGITKQIQITMVE